MSVPDIITTAKAVADMGGALVFSVFVAWELRALRAAFDRFEAKVTSVTVNNR